MGHRAVVFQFVVFMMFLGSMMSQRTFDNKIYDCELPEGCPNNTQVLNYAFLKYTYYINYC